MIALIPIIIAAICKAFADTLDHHFDTSIFRDKPRGFWDPNIILKKVKTVFYYPIDAWHIANSIQLASWLALPLVYVPKYSWWIDYSIGGGVFVIVFNLFYNKVFRK